MIAYYDTIHISIPIAHIKTEEQKKELISRIANVGYNFKEPFGETIYGYLDNLIVSISDKWISIKGSLAKYYYGDNLHPLSLADACLAIEKLSDKLSLPVRDGIIKRLDITANLLMEHSVPHYFNYLGITNRYTRIVQPTTLYYTRRDHHLVFYDKIAEMKSKREQIPPNSKNLNILRYELRFIRELPKLFNKALTVDMLLDKEVYRKLVFFWLEKYEHIFKERALCLEKDGLDIIEDFNTLARLALIQMCGSVTKVLQAIDVAKKLKPYTLARKAAVSRIKDKIKKLASHPEYSLESNLIVELDLKITEAYQESLLQLGL